MLHLRYILGPYLWNKLRGGSLDLAFNTIELRKICENEVYAKQKLGPIASTSLKHRLADLLAASSINDIIVGNLRPLDNNNKQMIIDITEDYVMVFSQNHRKVLTDDLGKIDWYKTTRIKILYIGSYDAYK